MAVYFHLLTDLEFCSYSHFDDDVDDDDDVDVFVVQTLQRYNDYVEGFHMDSFCFVFSSF